MSSGGAAEVRLRLRTARRSAGLTQRELAQHLGVESITISRWERGVTSPTLAMLRRVAEATGTTVVQLVGSDQRSDPSAEIAALREELAETRALVEQVAAVLERLVRPVSAEGSEAASRES